VRQVMVIATIFRSARPPCTVRPVVPNRGGIPPQGGTS